MTVNTLNITSGPYIGNGLNDTYSYTFRVTDETQLSVYETTDLGVQTLLTVDVDYTVTGLGVDGGGSVVRTAGNLPTDYLWYIRSNYIENQLTDFSSQGAFFPEIHEAQMDHITFLIQQLRDKLNRQFALSESIDIDGTFTISDVAADRAGKRLTFDESGDLEVSSDSQLITVDAVFDNVALMKTASLATGLTILTRGYYAAGDGGGATYLIVAPQAFDGYGDHELANSNIAVLQKCEDLNVKCFGANPSLANNTPQIQAAIDFASTNGGGVVILPAGVYACSDVYVRGSVTLQGVGRATVLLGNANSTYGVVYMQNPWATVRDMNIDGAEGTYTGNGVKIIGPNGWSTSVINVRFENISAYSLEIDDANAVSVRYCHFQGGTLGMLYGDGADNIEIIHNVFQAHICPFAIKVTVSGVSKSAHDAWIRSNWFEFGTEAVDDVIVVDAYSTSIINNHFAVSNAAQLSHIRVQGDADNTQIRFNNFQNTGATAKHVIIETGAVITRIQDNRGINAVSAITDNGTGTVLEFTESISGNSVTIANFLEFRKPTGTSGNINIDPTNVRIILNTANDYFGKDGANTVLRANAALRVRSGTGKNIEFGDGGGVSDWEDGHIVLGGYHLWVDSTGDLRIKSGAPASDGDGDVVGTQT